MQPAHVASAMGSGNWCLSTITCIQAQWEHKPELHLHWDLNESAGGHGWQQGGLAAKTYSGNKSQRLETPSTASRVATRRALKMLLRSCAITQRLP